MLDIFVLQPAMEEWWPVRVAWLLVAAGLGAGYLATLKSGRPLRFLKPSIVGLDEPSVLRAVGVCTLKNVLAVFAHPDDAELTCFGTLGILQARGYRVLVGIVTDGTAGSPQGSARIRVQEAEQASAIMGFDLLRGALRDGDLQYSSPLIMQIEEWVNEYKPAIVVTHDYDRVGLDHQDHIAVARAVLNIVHRKPEIELLLQVEPSRGSRSFEPNAFADVGPFAARKLAAIACHKSQSHKDYLQPAYIKMRSSWWAAVSGMWNGSNPPEEVHVEAFRIAKSSIFASSALAFGRPADTAQGAEPGGRVAAKYPRLRRVV